MNWGAAIAEARQLREMSQRRLATATGVQKEMISRIERGLRSPSISLLEHIAYELDVSMVALVAMATPRMGLCKLQRQRLDALIQEELLEGPA